MTEFDQLVERRINEAMQRGEFEGLEGEGRALSLDDDRDVPQEWRLAFRILKNAGYVPPQVALRTEIAALERALAEGSHCPSSVHGKLAVLKTSLGAMLNRTTPCAGTQYYHRVLEKLSEPR